MQIQIFNVPIHDNGEMLAELNKFLATHKVLDVSQQLCQNENGAVWCFCVRYILSTPTSQSQGNVDLQKRKKIDYKELLDETQFALFSKLRTIRKQLAAEDAVPAFAVFTDEELAGIAQLSEITEKSILSVNGIGERKAEKYGTKLLNLINEKSDSSVTDNNAS